MGITQLLFNPNGRIGQRDFLRGAILLTGFWIVAQVVIAYGGAALGLMIGLLTWASLYCYLCVYGKRLHDSGRSAWMFLLFLLGYFLLSGIVVNVCISLFAPQAAELRTQMVEVMEREGFVEAMMLHGPAYNQASLIPQMISLLVVNAILGYFGAKLKADPNSNQYGDPTGSGDVIL